MPYYRTTLTADRRTDTRYVDAPDMDTAARRSVRGWRLDARLDYQETQAEYTRYVFRGPRLHDVGEVRVYHPAKVE